MELTARLAVFSLLGALVPLTCQAASDEQKEFAFSVVERNAAPMAKIGDSIYYFAELGMQEFESTKLMKDVLEAGGIHRPARRRRHADQSVGALGQRTIRRSPSSARSMRCRKARRPRWSSRASRWSPGAPGHMEGHNTHGGLAAAAAFAVKETMHALQHPRQRHRLARPRRGAADQPALHRARRLLQGCRRHHLSAYRRSDWRPATASPTTPRSAPTSPSTARPRMPRSIPGTPRTRSTPAELMDVGVGLSAPAAASDLPAFTASSPMAASSPT